MYKTTLTELCGADGISVHAVGGDYMRDSCYRIENHISHHRHVR